MAVFGFTCFIYAYVISTSHLHLVLISVKNMHTRYHFVFSMLPLDAQPQEGNLECFFNRLLSPKNVIWSNL